jgi:hypothetical protein
MVNVYKNDQVGRKLHQSEKPTSGGFAIADGINVLLLSDADSKIMATLSIAVQHEIVTVQRASCHWLAVFNDMSIQQLRRHTDVLRLMICLIPQGSLKNTRLDAGTVVNLRVAINCVQLVKWQAT